jgi:hypothetical protein
MPQYFKPIIPKKDPFVGTQTLDQRLSLILRLFALDAVGKLARYPAPWSDYRRTGELGRGWFVSGPHKIGGALLVQVANRSGHAVWVQGPTVGAGPKQRALFREHGWQSVTDIRRQVWPLYKNKIKQEFRKRS